MIDEALSGEESGIGSAVSGVATEAEEAPSEANTGAEFFVASYLSTTEEDLLGHTDEHDDDTFDLVENAANAKGKPLHAGGNKDGDTTTTTKGGGKGKTKDTTDTTDTTNTDGTTDAGGTSTEEPAPSPDPEPAPEPTQQFGWLDSTTYLSGADTPDGFNIELVFNGSWTQSQKDVTVAQAEILSGLIVGDLADFGDIDDIRIQIFNDQYIDGSGGIWGQGGYMSLRGDGMVAEGAFRIDPYDIGTAESWEMLDELVMHEMLHAIGFGTTWHNLGLVSGNNYIGQNGVDVYGGYVPYDGSGHLSEAVGNEMGTTYITNNAENITDLTLAILEDMGFETIYNKTAYV